ncbi:MAG TPA: Asp-tRNA(Asn)/Glu-tRNA(Gln) amidotransferase subunit GatC [Nitrosospira sp.]|jgi:aspartyl-tRNA(Asn)/glutamyl-tRNA(Gln) amidotransferase subunit C
MSLSQDDVKRIANLARIELCEDEVDTVLMQLSSIFSLIEQMQAVDASAISPMSHAQDVTQRLRDDAVTETDQHILFQAVAPQVEAGLYLVPKVIE